MSTKQEHIKPKLALLLQLLNAFSDDAMQRRGVSQCFVYLVQTFVIDLGYVFVWGNDFITSKELEDDLTEISNLSLLSTSSVDECSAMFSQSVENEIDDFVLTLGDTRAFSSEDERVRWICFIAILVMFSKTKVRDLNFARWISETHNDMDTFIVSLGRAKALVKSFEEV